MVDLFVTGMVRSGTTLLQTLLTNHPQMLVAYQPFHNLYVDVKQRFLTEHGIDRLLPLGDGMSEPPGELARFHAWLHRREFSPGEVEDLVREAALGKGGGVEDLAGSLTARAGTFFQVRQDLQDQVAADLHPDSQFDIVGSKEVLCEEYVAALADSGTRCMVLLRDPRAVIASANHGSYRRQVGDRYPLLMLIRLWRKSVSHWHHLGKRDDVMCLRYEDLARDPVATLARVGRWLGVDGLEQIGNRGDLHDDRGRPWSGNSSFGSKQGVDTSSIDSWKDRLPSRQAAFIEACTRPELTAVGYQASLTPQQVAEVLEDFEEDESDVRTAYLADYRLDEANRTIERRRLEGVDGPVPRTPGSLQGARAPEPPHHDG